MDKFEYGDWVVFYGMSLDRDGYEWLAIPKDHDFIGGYISSVDMRGVEKSLGRGRVTFRSVVRRLLELELGDA